MKDYSHLIGKITSTPWMITPGALKFMLELFEAHMSGTISQEEIRLRLADVEKKPGGRTTRAGRIGVLALSGPIFPKANLMTELSGATDLAQFRGEFNTLIEDDSVAGVLIDIDSPGGMADHVEETAMEIREARKIKPVYAIANTAMHSAAYYIGSQATKLFATPSGQLGSVGTYTIHEDDTELRDKVGVKKTVIKAGRFKALHEEPLTAEGKAHIQDYVNDVNDAFVRNVALGRGVSEDFVRERFGEGGISSPQKALENKMIDGVQTIEQVIDKLSIDTGGSLAVAASAVATAIQQNASSVTLNFSDGTVTVGEQPLFKVGQSYDADKEHSEPGTGQGGEPTPREPPETGDKAIEGGWRRDPPPAAYETEEYTVNRAWMEERATALGVQFSAETSDDDLAKMVSERVDEVVVPLSQATAEAERARQFAEEYPEEAKRLARLEQRDRKSDAREFADGYRVFESNPNHGFSTLVREEIASAHLKLADRILTHEDLKNLVDTMASDTAVVPLSEGGSALEGEGKVIPARTRQEVRQQFTDAVKSVMQEDNLSRKEAVERVSKTQPDLARAYAES